MGNFYIDESIRDQGGFIAVAFVYSEVDLNPFVSAALRKVGLTPLKDEFKSSSKMIATPVQKKLREEVYSVLSKFTRIGSLITASSDRPHLGSLVADSLDKIVVANNLGSDRHHVYIDEGILPPGPQEWENYRRYQIHVNQDSKNSMGIQVADLAAHAIGSMVLEELGILKKTIFAGPESGYDHDTEMNLGFELRARVRYSLFCQPKSYEQLESADAFVLATYHADGFGFFLSPNCSDRIATAARDRLGTVYLGCMH